MKIIIRRGITRAELAAAVCSALEEVGDHPVLVGGAVVAIYTRGRYRSNDLDISTYRNRDELKSLMEEMGFRKVGRQWEHPATELTIDFVQAPAMVGNKYIRSPTRLKTKTGEVPLYSPLDSVCDRLSWYLQGEQQAMRQCIDMVVEHNVVLDEVADWLSHEGWDPYQKEAALTRLRAGVERRREVKRRRRKKKLR